MHVPAPPVHDCACCHHEHAPTLVPSLYDGLQAARTCVRAQPGLAATISWLDGCIAGSHKHGQGTGGLASATDGLSRCTRGSNQHVRDGGAPAIDGLDRCAAGSTEDSQWTDRLASAISGLVRCPVGSNQHVWASTSHTECFPQQTNCSCCQQDTKLLECTASNVTNAVTRSAFIA